MRRFLCGAATALIAAILPLGALADIKVLPTSATLDATSHVGVFTVQNQSTEPAAMQAKLFAWSQVDGTDRETATTTALLVPPVFTIDPYADQIVRFGMRTFAQTDTEQTYRVVFTQLPAASNGRSGLSVLFAFDVPVFVAPAGRKYSDLRWSIDVSDPQHPSVVARNGGTIHAQFRSLRILDANGSVLATLTAPGYVLAHSMRKWPVAFAPGARPASVEADNRSTGISRSPLSAP